MLQAHHRFFLFVLNVRHHRALPSALARSSTLPTKERNQRPFFPLLQAHKLLISDFFEGLPPPRHRILRRLAPAHSQRNDDD